jgi:hypothetical protein
MAVANLGIALSKRNRRVVLLDLDVDAPSMHFKFLDQGLVTFPYGGPKGGYIDYLKQYYEPLEGSPGKHMILDEIVLPGEEERVEILRRYTANVGSHLKLIPSGDSESNIYWRNLNSDWIHNLLSLRLCIRLAKPYLSLPGERLILSTISGTERASPTQSWRISSVGYEVTSILSAPIG